MKNKKESVDEYAKKIMKEVSSDVLKKPEVREKNDNGIQEDPKKSEVRGKNDNEIQGDLAEEYKINCFNSANVEVQIRKRGRHVIYDLKVPEIDVATKALLEEIRNELITTTTIGMNEIMDIDALEGIRKRFLKESEELLNKKIPTLADNTRVILINKLLQDMLGLGEIEFLINDGNLEEIVIPSAKEPIRVYHKKHGWLSTTLQIEREDEIINYSNIIARRVGRQISVLSPLLDAHLSSGDRINSILYPISTKGNTITIRRFARDPYTIIDLIDNKTIDVDIAILLWLAVEYEMNVLFSGGTASGKTVILNACMPFIPPNHRIISVEDTRELMLPDFLYWTPLVTRTPNAEGKGEVGMLDLLVASLRMRPDRIVLGEMRREKEAMVMFEAMHTGHSVYATMHANSAAETISRLTNPPLNVPINLLNAVNLNVVMFRDRRRGIRRALQVAEFNAQNGRADATVLYRWIADSDKIVRHAESSKFFEDITKNTGMTTEELGDNLSEKKNIIGWLLKNKIRDLSNFGRVMNLYYSDKETLLKQIKANNVKFFRKGKKEE